LIYEIVTLKVIRLGRKEVIEALTIIGGIYSIISIGAVVYGYYLSLSTVEKTFTSQWIVTLIIIILGFYWLLNKMKPGSKEI
jgi:hypothetical protein